MTQPDPRQRLTAAIAALLDPVVVRVDRLATTDGERDAVRATNAEAAANHRDQMGHYARQIARYEAYGDSAGVRRVQGLIARREAIHAEAIEQRRTAEATVPSLLDQVLAAVESSSSTGGAPSVGASRSPLGLAAVELIGDIARETECPRGARLDPHVRIWASESSDSDLAAELLEMWATAGRAIIEPARTAEARAACPVCNHRWTWAIEDGERVRKAVISINLSAGYAQCLNPSCATRWEKTHFNLLAAALLQDADERKASRTAARGGVE